MVKLFMDGDLYTGCLIASQIKSKPENRRLAPISAFFSLFIGKRAGDEGGADDTINRFTLITLTLTLSLAGRGDPQPVGGY